MTAALTTRARGLAAAALTQLAGIGLLLTSAWLVVRAAEQPPVLYLMVAIVGVRFFGVARAGLRYLERLWIHDAALGRAVDLRVAVRDDVARTAPRALTGRRRGDLVARVVADVDRVVDRDVRLVPAWSSAVVSVLAVAVVLAAIKPWFGVVVIVSASGCLLAARAAAPMLDEGAETRLAAVAAEAVRAAPELVVLGATEASGAEVRRAAADLQRVQRRAAVRSGLGSAAVLTATGLAMAVLATGTAGLAPVLVGVVVLAPLALADSLEAVVDAERQRATIAAARARLADLAAAADPVAGHGSRPRPIGWDLELAGVVAGWDAPVVGPVDLVVPEGAVVAVAGPSGAGKSTLGLTLARLLDPVDGTIRLGGVDVGDLDPAEVRGVVGYLTQDDVVLDTTLRENLAVARPDVLDIDAEAVLRRVGLGAFLDQVVDGLATHLGEGGRRLSGGERRRLSVARLLLAGHRVLVLDEPTEHLDADAADALLTDLLGLAPEHSLVLITHDPHAPEVAAGPDARLVLG